MKLRFKSLGLYVRTQMAALIPAVRPASITVTVAIAQAPITLFFWFVCYNITLTCRCVTTRRIADTPFFVKHHHIGGRRAPFVSIHSVCCFDDFISTAVAFVFDTAHPPTTTNLRHIARMPSFTCHSLAPPPPPTRSANRFRRGRCRQNPSSIPGSQSAH